MANYVRSNVFVLGLLDWDAVAVWSINSAFASTTTLTLANGDGTSTKLTGTGLTTDASGVPTGGIVSSMQRWSGPNGTGSVLETVSNSNWALIDLYANITDIGNFVLSGNDVIQGDVLNDQLDGHGGADLFLAGGGNDTILGDGADTLSYGGDPNAVLVNLHTSLVQGGQAPGTATDGFGGTDTLTAIVRVIGSAHDDTIYGGATNDTLTGGDGNDYLSGGDGNDALFGSQGVDTLEGGFGGDVLDGGGDGSFPGGDDDFASYEDAPSGVTADLNVGINTTSSQSNNTGYAQGDTYIDIQGLIGSNFNDFLRGNANVNYLLGGTGDDAFQGRDGNDYLVGDDGFDEARYDYNGGGSSAVLVNLDTGPEQLPNGVTMNVGHSSMSGSITDNDILIQIEAVRGTNSATGDTLIGSAGNNSFRGLRGADDINGGAGTDEVRYDQDANSSYATIPSSPSVGGTGGNRAVTVNLATHTAIDGFGYTDTLASIEIARGTNNLVNGDTLTGGDVANGTYVNEGFEGFRGLAGADIIDGGDGYDEVRYDSDVNYVSGTFNGTGAVVVNLDTVEHGGRAAGTARDGFGYIDTLTNIEGARGTNQGDTFYGNALQNKFFGLDGNDSFVLGDGFDYVEPGAGNDTIDGSSGSQINQAYDDRDFLSYDDFGANGTGVFIDLNLGTLVDPTGGIDTIIDIERLRGTSSSDTMLGSDTANLREEMFQGLAGADVIDGRAGYNIADYSRDATAGLGQGVGGADIGNLGIVADLAAGTITDGFGDVDHVYYVSGVRGTNFGDVFTGDAGRNLFRLFDGNDTVNGGAGTDRVEMYDGDLNLGAGAKVNLSSVAVLGIAAQTAISINGGVSGLTSIEDVMGSSSNDTLIGSDEANQIDGWLGDDSIDGGLGNDIVKGGAGADTIDGGGGIDRVSFLYDSTQYTYLHGVFPSLFGTPWGGVTVDLGGVGPTNIVNYDGSLGLVSNVENVTGTFFDDDITGDGGDNVFSGASGNDTIDGGGNGPNGDTISYALVNGDGRVFAPIAGINASLPNGVNVDLSTGLASDGEGGTDQLSNIENVIGSIGNDTIKGTAGNNHVDGGNGDDRFIFTGSLGVNTITGDTSFDVNGDYVGFDGNYTISTVSGGYQVVSVIDGTDTLVNINHLVFIDRTLDVPIPGATIDNSASTTPVETAGGQGDDSILGGNSNDTLEGGTGGDTIVGGDGDNFLFPGEGDDVATSGAGSATVELGEGAGNDVVQLLGANDTVFYPSTTQGIVVDLTPLDRSATLLTTVTTPGVLTVGDLLVAAGLVGVNATTPAGLATDSATAAVNLIETDVLIGVENVLGGDGDDHITGDGVGNRLQGGIGADTLLGAGGDDTLEGGSGNDSLVGGSGANVLSGDSDDDYLKGGADDDTLDGGAESLNGVDTADFSDAIGTLLLSIAEDGTGTASASGIGTDTFTNIEAFLYGAAVVDYTGNSGANAFVGSNGADTMRGGAGADTLTGGIGADSLLGEAGDDVFHLTGAQAATGEVIDGGADDDTLFIDGGGNVNLSGMTLSGLEQVALTSTVGTTLTIAGSAQAQMITSGAGVANPLTTVGDRVISTTALSVDDARHLVMDAGIERVEWVSGYGDTSATAFGGGFRVSYEDNALVHQFDSLDVFYNASGQQISQSQIFDSLGNENIIANHTFNPATGLLTQVVYTDQLNSRTFSEITVTLDANGVVTNAVTLNDNGNTDAGDNTMVEQTFVGGVISLERTTDTSSANAGQPWTHVDREYAGGVTQIFRTFWDNGVNGSGQHVVGVDGSQVIEGVAVGGGVATTNDQLIGGAGADTFRFAPDFGQDTIYDFVDGVDLLDLRSMTSGANPTGIDTLAELDAVASITEVAFGSGFKTVIQFDGVDESITIHGLSSLDANDFVLNV